VQRLRRDSLTIQSLPNLLDLLRVLPKSHQPIPTVLRRKHNPCNTAQRAAQPHCRHPYRPSNHISNGETPAANSLFGPFLNSEQGNNKRNATQQQQKKSSFFNAVLFKNSSKQPPFSTLPSCPIQFALKQQRHLFFPFAGERHIPLPGPNQSIERSEGSCQNWAIHEVPDRAVYWKIRWT
jgi:hypothetical protein